MFVIEELLYLIKYFTFKKSILLTKPFLILLELNYITIDDDDKQHLQALLLSITYLP